MYEAVDVSRFPQAFLSCCARRQPITVFNPQSSRHYCSQCLGSAETRLLTASRGAIRRTSDVTLQDISCSPVNFLARLAARFFVCFCADINKQCTRSRYQSPHGLRRGSAKARLLALWVHIPPGDGCLSVVIVAYCQVAYSVTS